MYFSHCRSWFGSYPSDDEDVVVLTIMHLGRKRVPRDRQWETNCISTMWKTHKHSPPFIPGCCCCWFRNVSIFTLFFFFCHYLENVIRSRLYIWTTIISCPIFFQLELPQCYPPYSWSQTATLFVLAQFVCNWAFTRVC